MCIRDRLSFVDTCQYEGDKYPGPGNYNVSGRIANNLNGGKIFPDGSVKPRKHPHADMNTYKPCAIEYDTFDRIALRSKDKNAASSPNASKSMNLKDKKSPKKNGVPGPGHYQVICTWKGKDKLKKGENHYWDKISSGPVPNVYYGQNA